MHIKYLKQYLSLSLALVMVLSLLPVPARASEETGQKIQSVTESTAATETTVAIETEPTQQPTEEPVASNPLIKEYQARVDKILVDYLGATDLTKAEIEAAVVKMEWDIYQSARWEISLLDEDILTVLENGVLSSRDIQNFFDNNSTLTIFSDLLDFKYSQEGQPSLYTYSETFLDGAVSISNVLSTTYGSVWSLGDNTITVRVYAKTDTITITNNSSSTKALSFDYSFSGNGTVKIDGTTITSGGSKSEIMPDESIVFEVTTRRPNTIFLTLNNFELTEVSDNSNVTIYYDSGSATVDGTSVTNGSTHAISASTGSTIAATQSNFVGWINKNTNKIISSSASFLFKPTETVSIKAIHGPAARFTVGEYLYETLDEAITAATNGSIKNIVLANNGTLPASTSNDGVYTIPPGVTLLIPYDAAGTLCTAKPSEHENAYTAPSVFRTLTMANGSNITVNGAISISGSISSKYGNIGMPSGPYGKINMNSGSKITVNGSAKLYAWGYITGAGSVEINNGGHVYECFQVADYRGGDATTQIVGKDDEYGVFPFNQYYVQNVEVPMTLHAGATETGYSAVYVRMAGHQPMSIPFIGNVENQSMFVISSGYIIKDYMEGTGRTKMGIYGDLKVTKVNVDIKVSLIGDISIDSSKYALPIPQHFNISLESGSVTMNQNVAFFPGSELYIREGTTCTLGSGKKIYVYDLDQWLYNEGKNGYSGTTNLPYMQLKHVPGGDGTTGRLKDALIQIDGTVDASAGSVYVTSGGANIYSTGTGKVVVGSAPDTTVRQVITNDTKIDSWPEITVKPVILQNAAGKDPAYVATTSESTATTYTYINGFWHKGTTCSGGTATCTAKAKCSTCGKEYGDLGKHTEVIDTATNPKWDAAGLTEGKHCSVCKTVIVRQQKIAAAKVGNIEYFILKDAIDAADRSTPVTLLHNIEGDVPVGKLVSIDTAGFTAEINAEEGFALSQDGSVVTVLIKIYATNISAGDGLDMYFYIHKNAMPDTNGYTPHITRDYADEDPQTVVAEWETYEEAPLWRFCYHDIAAKEMTDELTAVVTYDGVQVSNTHTETIKSYAIRTLGSKDKEDTEVDEGAALDTALMDMLNYGAGAQTIFNYNTGELANIVYDETTEGKLSTYVSRATQEDIITESNLVKGSDNNLKAVSVSAKNKLMLTFYFANITTDMTAEITYTNHNEAVMTDTVNGSEFVPYGNWLGVDVTGLAIADGRQVVTCTVKDGDKTIATASDSVEGYVHRNSGSNEVLKLLMKFVDSAYNYFHPTGDA